MKSFFSNFDNSILSWNRNTLLEKSYKLEVKNRKIPVNAFWENKNDYK